MFKIDCQRNTARLQKMKNTQSKIKPIKTGKKNWNNVLFRV